MSVRKRATVELTRIEIKAALEACSNYTPVWHKGWKQAAQARVVTKLSHAHWKLDHNARRWS
ncbi:hypothetical protein LCGC14_3020970 [marine sediment metagenome]|uniref:Uncharacterized protein n=1 Tax=marine sediment metagenome TaxID=412755 RepID=A0A0F8Z2U1_9ZZZZ